MEHAPAAHPVVALAKLQAWPQVPQFTGALRGDSQPFAGLRSQSPKPVKQRPTVQAPLKHPAEALRREQTWPHPPQFAVSLAVSVQRPPQTILGLGQAGGTSATRSFTTSVGTPVSGPPTST